MKNMLITPDRRFKNLNFSAELVELADTRVLGTRIARCEGSSPLFRTKKMGMVSSVVSEMLTLTKKKASESNTTRGNKNCCRRCCIEEEMLQSRKGKLIVGSIIEVVIGSKT